MASSTGRTAFQTPSKRPQRTPTGMPIRAHNATATMIIPRVSAVSSQYSMPSSPQMARATATNPPTLTLRTRVPMAKNRRQTAIHGMSVISHQGLVVGALDDVAEQEREGPLNDAQQPLQVERDPVDHLLDPVPEGNGPLVENLVVRDAGRIGFALTGSQEHLPLEVVYEVLNSAHLLHDVAGVEVTDQCPRLITHPQWEGLAQQRRRRRSDGRSDRSARSRCAGRGRHPRCPCLPLGRHHRR